MKMQDSNLPPIVTQLLDIIRMKIKTVLYFHLNTLELTFFGNNGPVLCAKDLSTHYNLYTSRRDGVVVRASASQSVDLGLIPLFESYQKTLKNSIHSFPAWRSAFRGGCGEQAGKFACCVLGQGT